MEMHVTEQPVDPLNGVLDLRARHRPPEAGERNMTGNENRPDDVGQGP
jgi:hypothetical protein